MTDISCSPLRPPNNTANLILSFPIKLQLG
jgi:hypothetical protein